MEPESSSVDSQELVVEYVLRWDEFLEIYLGPSRSVWRPSDTMRIIACVIFGITWLLRAGSAPSDRWMWAIAAVGIGAFTIDQANKRHRYLRQQWRSYYEEELFRVTLGASEAASQNSSGSNTYFWRALTHFSETPLMFLICRHKQIELSIPKRALGDEARVAMVRELLMARLGRTSARPLRAFPVQSVNDMEANA